tara:strand:+ start:285 stop:416 length:132 start_codon:yes stop_codon:yes gene_type:complete
MTTLPVIDEEPPSPGSLLQAVINRIEQAVAKRISDFICFFSLT